MSVPVSAPLGAHASRVAVVFNASSRLGRAMSLELAIQGFSLALCTRTPADMEATVDEAFNSVEVSPFKVSAYECNLTDLQSASVCAREIFEDFGRIDVLCFVEKRQDDLLGFDDEGDAVPVLNADGTILRPNLSPSTSDIACILDCFFPLLRAAKPAAPPIKFFEHIPQGARRLHVHEDEDDDDYSLQYETHQTSLLLYISTPDSIACRAGRSETSTRVRAIEAILEGINAEAIARGDLVRASTAIVGTLDGELPFWRFDREQFLQQAKRVESEMRIKREQTEQQQYQHLQDISNSASRVTITEIKHSTTVVKTEGRSLVQSMIPKRFRHTRRPSRSRGIESDRSVVEVDDDDINDDKEEGTENDDGNAELQTKPDFEDSFRNQLHSQSDNDDDDHIPPPSPPPFHLSPPQKLTSESLTHAEASAWIIWGLSRGRTRIVVGYDALFLLSAWVPNAFLNRLFSFAGARRNLLPIRTTDDFMIRTESAKRAQAKYDEARQRRQRAREIVTLMLVLFCVFSPAVAMLLLFLVTLWHRTVTSDDGHAATERAVAMVLYLVSLRRRYLIHRTWETIRSVERFVFGSLAQNVTHFRLKADAFLEEKKRLFNIGRDKRKSKTS